MFNQYKLDMRLCARGQHTLKPTSYYKLKRFNPYVNELPVEVMHKTSESLEATLGKISPYSCKGHFPQYPCLPVAVLMGALNNINLKLLHTAEPAMRKGCLLDSKIKAENLALANTVVDIKAAIIQQNGDIIRICTRAVSPGQEIIYGEAVTTYQVLK